MNTRLLLAAVLLGAACHKPPKDGGLIADIRINSDTHVTCVEMLISDMDGKQLVSKRFPRAGRDEIKIGIGQVGDTDLPADVRIRVQGLWSVSECTEPARLNSAPADQQAHFTAATVTPVDFTLRLPDMSDDGDGDGYTGATRGGPDCDDSLRGTNPGAMEACAVPVDFNCNGRVGCDDPACAGVACVRPAAALAFASVSQSVVATQCSQAIVIEARDDQNMPAPVSATTAVTLGEQGAALGLQFFSDSGCTLPATSVDIPKGMREARFYARTSVAGTTRLDASATGFMPVQQDFRVIAGMPVSIAFRTAAQMVKNDACSQPVIVEARDMSGNTAPVAIDLMVTLSAMPAPGLALFSDASCSAALMLPRLAAGTPSLTFYFKPTRAPGTVALIASAMGLGSAMQNATVIPGDPARALFVTTAQRVVAGACSGALTMKLQDSQMTDTVAAMPVTLMLNPSATLSFFTGNTCAMPSMVNAASIPAGAGTATVYFVATVAGSTVTTASGSGLALISQTQTIDPAPPVKLAFATPSQGVGSTLCSGQVRLEAQDPFNNPSPVVAALGITLTANPSAGFLFYASTGCASTGMPSLGISIGVGQSFALFSYRGSTAGTVVMTAASMFDPDPTQSTRIGVNPPDRLAYLSPTTPARIANTCSAIVTLESRDSGGNRSNVSSAVTVNLSASPPGGFQFFTNSQCSGTPVTSVTLAANASQVDYYWLGTAAGTITITATGGSLMPPSPLAATVTPGQASNIVFATPPRSAIAGTCSAAITVQSRDAFGNIASVGADTTLMLGAAAGLTYYLDSTCSGATTTTATIPSGMAAISFYARGTVAPSYNVTAQHPSVGMITQALAITPAGAAKLVVTTTAQTLLTGQCSGALTFERRDVFDNAITAGTLPVALGATGSGSAGIQFFPAAGCGAGTAIGATSIVSPSSIVTVFFRSTAPGMPTLSGTGTGVPTAGTQAQTINVSPPTVLAFSSAPQPMVTAGTPSGAVVLEARDAFGNPSAPAANTTITLSALPSTFDYCGDPGCVGLNPTVQIGAGLTSTTFYFRGNIAQTITIGASASGFTSTSQMNTVVAAAVSQLKITAGANQNRAAGSCSTPVTVQRQDQYGNPVSSGSTPVTLGANPATGFTFYQGGACATSTGTVTITTGSTTTFNFLGSVPGPVQVTVSSSGLASDTATETIGTIAPNHFSYLTMPQVLQATTPCSGAVTVEARDMFNNPAGVVANTTVTPSTNGGNPTFFLDAACSSPVSSFIMPSGATTATYYLTATTASPAGTPFTLTTAGTSLTSATQSLTVGPGAAVKMGFVGTGQTVGVDLCSTLPATVRTLDTFNNVSPVSAMTTITPSASPLGGLTFFTNAACSTGSGGTFVLNTGESQGQFWMKGGALPGGSTVSVSLMASPSLSLVAPQTETVAAGAASRLAITSGPQTLMAGECSPVPIVVEARDAADNNTTVSSNTTVNLAALLGGGAPTGFLFYSAAGCGTSTTTTQINLGQGTASFYVKGITGGTFDLTASTMAPGYTQAGTQAVVVQPAVRSGTCTIADAAPTVSCAITPALNANLSRTLLLFQTTTGVTAALDSNAVRCVLADASTITCSRFGTTGAVSVRWYTVSRPSGLVVQHLNAIASTAAVSQTVAINSVISTASTFLLLSSQAAGGITDYSDPRLTTARLTMANQVTLQRFTAPDVSLTYGLQVVQWAGSTVERGSAGTTVLANNTTSIGVASLPDTGTNPVFLLHSWRWGTAGGGLEMCHLGIRGALASTTSLNFTRTSGNNANACKNDDMTIEYERVMLPGAASANRVEVFTINTSAASTTQAIASVDTTRAVPFFGGHGFGGGQSWGETADPTASRVRDVTARATFIDATTVSIDRGVGSSTNGTWTLFVWQFVP